MQYSDIETPPGFVQTPDKISFVYRYPIIAIVVCAIIEFACIMGLILLGTNQEKLVKEQGIFGYMFFYVYIRLFAFFFSIPLFFKAKVTLSPKGLSIHRYFFPFISITRIIPLGQLRIFVKYQYIVRTKGITWRYHNVVAMTNTDPVGFYATMFSSGNQTCRFLAEALSQRLEELLMDYYLRLFKIQAEDPDQPLQRYVVQRILKNPNYFDNLVKTQMRISSCAYFNIVVFNEDLIKIQLPEQKLSLQEQFPLMGRPPRSCFTLVPFVPSKKQKTGICIEKNQKLCWKIFLILFEIGLLFLIACTLYNSLEWLFILVVVSLIGFLGSVLFKTRWRITKRTAQQQFKWLFFWRKQPLVSLKRLDCFEIKEISNSYWFVFFNVPQNVPTLERYDLVFVAKSGEELLKIKNVNRAEALWMICEIRRALR